MFFHNQWLHVANKITDRLSVLMLVAHMSPGRSTILWTLVSYPLVLLFIKDFPRTHRHFVKSCFLATLVLKTRNPRRFLTGVMWHFRKAHQEHWSKQKLAFIVGFGSGGIAYPQQNSQLWKMLAKVWVKAHNPKKGNVCDFRTPKVWKKMLRASGGLWQWCVWYIMNIPNISLHKKLKKGKPLANANVTARTIWRCISY